MYTHFSSPMNTHSLNSNFYDKTILFLSKAFVLFFCSDLLKNIHLSHFFLSLLLPLFVFISFNNNAVAVFPARANASCTQTSALKFFLHPHCYPFNPKSEWIPTHPQNTHKHICSRDTRDRTSCRQRATIHISGLCADTRTLPRLQPMSELEP